MQGEVGRLVLWDYMPYAYIGLCLRHVVVSYVFNKEF